MSMYYQTLYDAIVPWVVQRPWFGESSVAICGDGAESSGHSVRQLDLDGGPQPDL